METKLYFEYEFWGLRSYILIFLDDLLFDKSDISNFQVNVLKSRVKVFFIWSCSLLYSLFYCTIIF